MTVTIPTPTGRVTVDKTVAGRRVCYRLPLVGAFTLYTDFRNGMVVDYGATLTGGAAYYHPEHPVIAGVPLSGGSILTVHDVLGDPAWRATAHTRDAHGEPVDAPLPVLHFLTDLLRALVADYLSTTSPDDLGATVTTLPRRTR